MENAYINNGFSKHNHHLFSYFNSYNTYTKLSSTSEIFKKKQEMNQLKYVQERGKKVKKEIKDLITTYQTRRSTHNHYMPFDCQSSLLSNC